MLDIFREALLQLPGQFRGCLAARLEILDQRRRDASIRPDRDGDVQVLVVPDKYLQAVTRADAIFGRIVIAR